MREESRSGGEHSLLAGDTRGFTVSHTHGTVPYDCFHDVSWDNSWSNDSCLEVPERCSSSYSRDSISSHLIE